MNVNSDPEVTPWLSLSTETGTHSANCAAALPVEMAQVQFLDNLLARCCARQVLFWSRQYRIPWRFLSCSLVNRWPMSLLCLFAVAVHRQGLHCLMVFCRIFRHFSHSVHLDISAHSSALDDEEFFVVEGSGWWGRRESDSQVFCHPNSLHAWWHIDKDIHKSCARPQQTLRTSHILGSVSPGLVSRFSHKSCLEVRAHKHKTQPPTPPPTPPQTSPHALPETCQLRHEAKGTLCHTCNERPALQADGDARASQELRQGAAFFPLCRDFMADSGGQPSEAAWRRRERRLLLDASARAADRPHGPGSCSPPQCWSEGKGGDAAERRPTGTEDRRQGRSKLRTPAYGHRRLLHQGSGQASSRSLGRRGVTAAGGTPQGTASRPSACPYWLERRESRWTPPRCASSLLWRCGGGKRRRRRLRRRPRSRRRSRRTRCSSKPLLRWSKRDSFSSATRRRGRGVFLGPLLSPRMAMLVVDIGSGTFLAGFSSSFVGRPELPGMMVGMDVKDSVMCCAGFAGCDAPRAVFSSVVARPEMLGIMPVWTRRTVFREIAATFVVDSCSGMCTAGFPGTFLLALDSFLLSAGPRCSASWPV